MKYVLINIEYRAAGRKRKRSCLRFFLCRNCGFSSPGRRFCWEKGGITGNSQDFQKNLNYRENFSIIMEAAIGP